MENKPAIQICFSPELAGSLHSMDDAVVVVTDVLRATTSMIVALAGGVKAVIPVSALDEAVAYKQRGYMLAGERGGQKLEFADFGNSPEELLRADLADKKLVFTTTNGTRAIHTARSIGSEVYIGGFINLSALASRLEKLLKPVVILCSGWNGAFCMEDTLFAGAMAEKLMASGKFILLDDAAHASVRLWQDAEGNPMVFAEASAHLQRLRRLGAAADIQYAFQQDIFRIVPVLQGEEICILHPSG
ncbi:MAG: 2-phosphosulfolactate phosphatase [Bacteroidales bacterium]